MFVNCIKVAVTRDQCAYCFCVDERVWARYSSKNKPHLNEWPRRLNQYHKSFATTSLSPPQWIRPVCDWEMISPPSAAPPYPDDASAWPVLWFEHEFWIEQTWTYLRSAPKCRGSDSTAPSQHLVPGSPSPPVSFWPLWLGPSYHLKQTRSLSAFHHY